MILHALDGFFKNCKEEKELDNHVFTLEESTLSDTYQSGT